MPSTAPVSIIIAGAGLSGLTLALECARRPFFQNQRIVLIDRDEKNRNDRTWCFWARAAEPLPPIIHQYWSKARFFNETLQKNLEMGPFRYQMVRSADFYAYAKAELSRHPAIEWIKADITGLDAANGIVHTDQGDFQATWVLNSALYPDSARPYAGRSVDGGKWEGPSHAPDTGRHTFLLQHFKGWVLETPEPAFDPASITFMDYRIAQEAETRFVYVLPLSETRALVEFTVFSPALLHPEYYDETLRQYCSNILNIKNYRIEETEFGVIPMTDLPLLPLREGRVIHIGTAGGFVKASSGYGFLRTQRKIRNFVSEWERTGTPNPRALQSKALYHALDSIMLRVLYTGAVSGKTFFSLLFEKLPAHIVLRFLDEDARFSEVFRILSAPPVWPFFKTALRQLPLLFRLNRSGI